MIVSNGTTSLTLTDAWSNPNTEIETDSSMTAGGRIKWQVGGERFKTTELAVVTAAELRSFFDIIKASSGYIYYTPSEIPPEYTSANFPMTVHIDKITKTVRASNGTSVIYHISFDVTGTEYL